MADQKSNMLKVLTKTFNDNKISIIDDPERKTKIYPAKETLESMGYVNYNKLVSKYVPDDQKLLGNAFENSAFQGHSLKLRANSVLITQKGLDLILMQSKKPIAKQFREWLCDVLETIRTKDSIATVHNYNMHSEKELQKNFIRWLNKYFKHVPRTIGSWRNDMSQDEVKEMMQMGMLKGTPDIMIHKQYKKHIGLAVELKNPNGRGLVSEDQELMHERLEKEGFKVIVSNDFADLVYLVGTYLHDAENVF